MWIVENLMEKVVDSDVHALINKIMFGFSTDMRAE